MLPIFQIFDRREGNDAYWSNELILEAINVILSDNFNGIEGQTYRVSYDIYSETEEGGSVEDNRDGTYTYTPLQNFTGEDSFEYTICDNADTPNCSTVTVTITVSDATPVANDDSYETTEDKDLSIVSFLNSQPSKITYSLDFTGILSDFFS